MRLMNYSITLYAIKNVTSVEGKTTDKFTAARQLISSKEVRKQAKTEIPPKLCMGTDHKHGYIIYREKALKPRFSLNTVCKMCLNNKKCYIKYQRKECQEKLKNSV